MVNKVKTYTQSGKARKPCPSCKKYVHARVTICACGHEFQSKAKTSATPPGVPSKDDVIKILTILELIETLDGKSIQDIYAAAEATTENLTTTKFADFKKAVKAKENIDAVGGRAAVEKLMKIVNDHRSS
ncbi:MAG: hypothetical protein ABGW78_04670 [Pirellulales bacterium]